MDQYSRLKSFGMIPMSDLDWVRPSNTKERKDKPRTTRKRKRARRKNERIRKKTINPLLTSIESRRL